MARVQSSSGSSVSLFPFMSILACLAGTVVVMICVLVMVQAISSKNKASQNPNAVEMMKVQEQLAELRGITDQLTNVEAMEKRLVLLREIAAGDETNDVIRARMQKEIENLRIAIANAKNDKPRVQKEIAKLKEDMAERMIKPEDLKPALRVQGGGSGFAVGRRLFVIEANRDSIIVHRSKEDRSRITAGAIGADKEYNDFLAEVARHKNHQILFVVRTDGQSSYDRGAGWAQQQFKLSTSKMPIPGQGKVDLSEFEKFMK